MSISGLSTHAAVRFQQRGIPEVVFDLLEQYGDTERSGGSETLFFSKTSLSRISRALGDEFRHFERWSRVYAVVADSGVVVTAGHRFKRIKRR